MKNLNNIKLDLSNPEVVEQLKANDVTKVKDAPVDDYEAKISQKIKDRQKAATFNIKLTLEQVEKLTRDGASLGLDWKQYLEQQINELIFSKGIGAATISSPSFGRKKVMGPSKWLQNNE